jgi:septation ring formation regulator EzrA
METTIGQLNFFKWAIDNKIISFIEDNYELIERDMNIRNSTTKKHDTITDNVDNTKTRKKREELSLSACKCIKTELVKIVVKFDL